MKLFENHSILVRKFFYGEFLCFVLRAALDTMEYKMNGKIWRSYHLENGSTVGKTEISFSFF